MTTHHSASPTSLSSSPIANQVTTASESSLDTTSQPAKVILDDNDDVFDELDVGLIGKLSSVDPRIHSYPPPGSYQPRSSTYDMKYKREAAQRTKKLKTKTKRLHSTTATTTGRSTVITHNNKAATISSSKPSSGWWLDTCPRGPTGDSDASMTLQVSVETAAATPSSSDTAFNLHNEATYATDDVTPSTSDVISSPGDVVNDNEKNNDEAAGSSSERVLYCKTLPLALSSPAANPPRKQFNTVHVERPTNRFNLASSDSQHNDSNHIDDAQDDDKQPPAAGQHDDNTYQRLDGDGRSWQRSSGEYTELRPQSTRDSVISDASYETIRSCHAAAYTSDNDGVTTGDYLHPMSVHSFTP